MAHIVLGVVDSSFPCFKRGGTSVRLKRGLVVLDCFGLWDFWAWVLGLGFFGILATLTLGCVQVLSGTCAIPTESLHAGMVGIPYWYQSF